MAVSKRFCPAQMVLEFDKQESVPKCSNPLCFFIRGLPEAELILCTVNESWSSDQSALADFKRFGRIERGRPFVFAEIIEHDGVEGDSTKCSMMKGTSESLTLFHKESVG